MIRRDREVGEERGVREKSWSRKREHLLKS